MRSSLPGAALALQINVLSLTLFSSVLQVWGRMIRALYLISYYTRGILYGSIFGDFPAGKAARPAHSALGVERRTSGNLTPTRQASDAGERSAPGTAHILSARLSPLELNERLLRTLEELLPPVWAQLGLSEAAADREQVLRLEDYTILVRRLGDVVAVIIGEREHESLLLLEFGQRFEQCLRRTLHLEGGSVLPFTASEARSNVATTLEPPLLSSGTSEEAQNGTSVGYLGAGVDNHQKLEQILVERYEELCHIIATMVSEAGIVNTMDPETVSSLV
jgi:hypothetical protein